METFTKEQFWAELDTLGEEEVRIRIATQRYGLASDKRSLAEEWLKRESRRADFAASSRRDAREEETLALAKEANEISRSASKKAFWANVIAIGSAVLAAAVSIVVLLIERAKP